MFTSSSNFSYSDIISTEISNCISSPTISSSLSSSSSVLQVYFTLDAKGGEIKDTNWLKSGDKYITYLDTSLPIPEKTGYIFVSWQNENGIVEKLIQGGNAYAVWQEISYPIQYILGEGENDINNPSSYNYFDEPFVLQPAICQGKDFVGWFLDEEFNNQTLVIPNTKEKVIYNIKWLC